MRFGNEIQAALFPLRSTFILYAILLFWGGNMEKRKLFQALYAVYDDYNIHDNMDAANNP